LATITTLVFICAPVSSAPGLSVPTAPQEQPQEPEVVDQGYTGQILLVDAAGLDEEDLARVALVDDLRLLRLLLRRGGHAEARCAGDGRADEDEGGDRGE